MKLFTLRLEYADRPADRVEVYGRTMQRAILSAQELYPSAIRINAGAAGDW